MSLYIYLLQGAESGSIGLIDYAHTDTTHLYARIRLMPRRHV
jgi:hypothetical protein